LRSVETEAAGVEGEEGMRREVGERYVGGARQIAQRNRFRWWLPKLFEQTQARDRGFSTKSVARSSQFSRLRFGPLVIHGARPAQN